MARNSFRKQGRLCLLRDLWAGGDHVFYNGGTINLKKWAGGISQSSAAGPGEQMAPIIRNVYISPHFFHLFGTYLRARSIPDNLAGHVSYVERLRLFDYDVELGFPVGPAVRDNYRLRSGDFGVALRL